METKKTKKEENIESMFSEKELFLEESKREFSLPKEDGLPRGFQVFGSDDYFVHQRTQNKEQKVKIPSIKKPKKT